MEWIMKLNIGCGEFAQPDWVNTDITQNKEVRPDIICSALDLPFDDGFFDAVYVGHILEHIPEADVAKALSEVYRVLATGGSMACVGPDIEKAEALQCSPPIIAGIHGGAGRWETDRHYWLPTDASITKVMVEAGFTDARPVPIASLQGTHWPVVSYAAWQHSVVASKEAQSRLPLPTESKHVDD
jgi:predicted SAM-dependent methyltransferase